MARVVELYDRTSSLKVALNKICVNLFLHFWQFQHRGQQRGQHRGQQRGPDEHSSVFIIKINDDEPNISYIFVRPI